VTAKPAGGGADADLMPIEIAASVPPALSPPTASRVPSSPSEPACVASQCIAAQASSTAVGKRCSGASL